jgi:hypothetical protein
MTQTFIYAIHCPNKNEIKIGYAGNPVSRLLQLQTGTTDRLDLLMTFIGSNSEEKELHTLLSEHRVSGEWFVYNSAVLTTLDKYYKTNFPTPKDRGIEIAAKEVILEKAYSLINSRGNRKNLTIPELKKQLTSVTLTTKEVQDILLNAGWEIVKLGTCATKFFRPKY